MLVRAASLDCHLKHTLHFHHLFPFAHLASVLFFHVLSQTSAVPTSTLRLRVHARPQLNQFCYHSLALAFGALCHVLASFTLAGLANAISRDLNVFHSTVEDLFQSHLQLHQFCFAFLRSGRLPASSTEHFEKSAEASSSRWASVFDSLFSVVIIELSFFGV